MLPKVVVQFTVGVRGRVTSAQVDGPPPEDARYGECLLDVVRRVKTPPPKGGPVVVRYPFLICGAGF
jgi:TonB family protein